MSGCRSVGAGLRAASLSFALVALAPASSGAQESEPPAAPAAPAEPPAPVLTPYEARYHARAEGRALLEAWAAASHVPCRLFALPTPAGPGGRGVELLVLELGAEGPVPLAERPTVVLLGAPDGVSLAGAEAVLASARGLLGASLPPDLAFVAIPWAAPEALERTLVGTALDGRGRSPIDDDGDARVDEDGPDDLDGDGHVLEMLVPDPEGEWILAADRRLLAHAMPGDGPRYRRVPEGRDDDHDGRWNEDPPGGIVLDRSFPIGWESAGGDTRAGSFPLASPVGRALAQLLTERPIAAVLVFQSNHGLCAAPGGVDAPWPAEADHGDHELVARLFGRTTGRQQTRARTLEEASGVERPGTLVDWVYGVLGAYAYEIAPWGPSVEATSARDAAPSSAAWIARAREDEEDGVPALERAWARWLDNNHGGIGFVDWHPVELGDGVQALVGGWEPFSRANPPAESLPAALSGLPEFVLGFAEALPRLELRVGAVEREGDLCLVRARLANAGRLSSGLWTSGRAPLPNAWRRGARVALKLPPGARLFAGELAVDLGPLSGGTASREVAWAVLAPPGSGLVLEGQGAFVRPVAQEVRP